MEIQAWLATYAEKQRALEQMEAEYQDAYQEIVAPIAEELAGLTHGYDARREALQREVASVAEQIKIAVTTAGHTVKGHGYTAVFVQGRVSWDDAFLQGYAVTHDEILQGRKEGKPSVSLRKEKG